LLALLEPAVRAEPHDSALVFLLEERGGRAVAPARRVHLEPAVEPESYPWARGTVRHEVDGRIGREAHVASPGPVQRGVDGVVLHPHPAAPVARDRIGVALRA